MRGCEACDVQWQWQWRGGCLLQWHPWASRVCNPQGAHTANLGPPPSPYPQSSPCLPAVDLPTSHPPRGLASPLGPNQRSAPTYLLASLCNNTHTHTHTHPMAWPPLPRALSHYCITPQIQHHVIKGRTCLLWSPIGHLDLSGYLLTVHPR